MREIKLTVGNAIYDMSNGEVGNDFRLTVKADSVAVDEENELPTLKWYERTGRTYPGGPEREDTWEDLFAKHMRYADESDKPNLFREAADQLRSGGDMEFAVVDKPNILTCNGDRTLDFIFAVCLAEEETYIAAARQKITISEEDGKKKANVMFSCTEFKRIHDNSYLYCIEVNQDSLDNPATGLLHTLELGALETKLDAQIALTEAHP